MKLKILLTRRWPDTIEKALAEDFNVTIVDDPLTFDQWRQAMQEYDALCPCVADKLPAGIFQFDKPSRTKLIANYGVGYNHIDIVAAAQAGVAVTNTPGVLTDATADIALTLMLMISRRAGEAERQLRAGLWPGWYPTHLMGTSMTGKTLGIVGMGRIGQALAMKAAHGFGMKILYHNRRELHDARTQGMQAIYYKRLENMLPKCDFVSLHCPGGTETRHLFDTKMLSLLPTHSYLINTARGDIIDENALYLALREGNLAGAGLDVYELEPSVEPGLLRLENVVLLPHLGSATLETRTAMGERARQNLLAFAAGKELPDRVV